MRILILAIAFITCSCATVKKQTTSTSYIEEKKDTTASMKGFSRETTTVETGATKTIIPADSLTASGAISAEDTSEYTQQVEGNGISLKTTIKPQTKNGKIVGYRVSSNAKTTSKEINIPTIRTTNSKESGTEILSHASNEIKQTTDSVSSKSFNFKLGAWSIIGIACGLILVFYILYKYARK